jgi:hypothetical protein
MYFRQAALRRSQTNGHDNFQKIQGTMSEDEALARALQASMQQQSPISAGGNQASNQDKNKCSVS